MPMAQLARRRSIAAVVWLDFQTDLFFRVFGFGNRAARQTNGGALDRNHASALTNFLEGQFTYW